MSGRIICGDARTAIPKVPVQLVVTSPPYNVGINYDEHDDLMGPTEYKVMLTGVLWEAWNRLVEGGRMAVNIQHTYGRNPAYPLGHIIESIMLTLPDNLYRGAIIWDKSASVGPSTAWGTWQSPRNPVLRGEYEMIYVFAKGSMTRESPVDPDITGGEFKKATSDVWRDVGTTSKDRSGHPAAFPHTLAQRLIQLYSFPGDVVLDPFFGSGTTGKAAQALGRDWIGVDISEAYCKLAQQRIEDEGFGAWSFPIEYEETV
jgi:site-specific DNA-methyltransferase (adenine-specific)